MLHFVCFGLNFDSINYHPRFCYASNESFLCSVFFDSSFLGMPLIIFEEGPLAIKGRNLGKSAFKILHFAFHYLSLILHFFNQQFVLSFENAYFCPVSSGFSKEDLYLRKKVKINK